MPEKRSHNIWRTTPLLSLRLGLQTITNLQGWNWIPAKRLEKGDFYWKYFLNKNTSFFHLYVKFPGSKPSQGQPPMAPRHTSMVSSFGLRQFAWKSIWQLPCVQPNLTSDSTRPAWVANWKHNKHRDLWNLGLLQLEFSCLLNCPAFFSHLTCYSTTFVV